ncbi:MAG TPA: SNF2-related protein, partial [Opitutales bacterium]|nr:SNF2-related protein [Opitutales bacterium]
MEKLIYQDLPDLSTGVLVDMGGWPALREARRLFESGSVKEVHWEKPFLKADIESGGKKFSLKLALRSTAFAENSCPCETGRKGFVCAHALAACLAADAIRRESEKAALTPPKKELKRETPPAPETAPKAPGRLLSLNVDSLGRPLTVRLILPPNLESAAARNMLVVKLDLIYDGRRIPPEKMFRKAPCRIEQADMEALLLVEKLGHGSLASILQLKRAELAEFIRILAGRNAFEWIGIPDKFLAWEGAALAGVSKLLAEPDPASPAAPVVKTDIKVRRGSGVVAPRQSVLESIKPAPKAPPSRIAAPRPDAESGRMEIDGSPHFLAVMIPRDYPLRERALRMMEVAGFRLEPSNTRWWLRDRHKVLNFLAEHGDELRKVFAPDFSDNYRTRMQALKSARLVAKTVAEKGVFNLTMRLDAGPVSEEEIRRAVASHQFYVASGEAIWLVPPALLEKLAAAGRALSGEPGQPLSPSFSMKIAPARMADADEIISSADEVETPAQWKGRIQALRNFSSLEAPPIPQQLDATLRGYQRIGAAWLWNLWKNELGGVLADEMGLGKTVQAAALLSAINSRETGRPLLVVCPAGLVENWIRELNRFAPELKVLRHHGPSRIEDFGSVGGGDVVLTSYQTLVRDSQSFVGLHFAAIVADEAQHIKNRRTQAAAALRALAAKARFVLTGTPVENSLDDLRSIFSFILPGYLAKVPDGVRGEDRDWFDKRHLKQAAPYILRRAKTLVAPELPPVMEQTVFCEMSPVQGKLYGEYLEEGRRAIFEMEMGGASDGRLRMEAFTRLLRLRQICADPRILKPAIDAADSAKLRALEEILNEAIDGGHRLLVFSQFVEALHLIAESLKERDISFAYIDGSTPNRQAEVDRFNADASIPVFLIS